MYSDCRLVIFTRFPIPGKAKTRLIPVLGAEGAALHQKMMTEFIVSQAKGAGVSIEIRYTDGSDEEMRNWLGNDILFKHQGDGDLGQRMARAISENLNHDLKKVAIIGSDCPDFRSSDIKELFKELEVHPIAIGPATDGGYYTIGMNVLHSELFTGIDWGTDKVLSQTLSSTAIPIKLLTTRSDVDELSDLVPKISVVIPTLNEEKTIEPTLKQVKKGYYTQILVVDGGSTDSTVEIVEKMGVSVIHSLPGRGIQQRIGCEISTGEIVLLLHADTILPENWDITIRSAFKNQKIGLTAFRLRINEQSIKYKLVEFGVTIRSILFRLPYGDQAIAVRKQVLNQIGGFPNRLLMEDVYLVKKIRKLSSIRLLRTSVLTSNRRWKKYGVLKTTIYNQFILWADWLGATDFQLKDLYYSTVSLSKLLRFCFNIVLAKKENRFYD